MEILSPVSRPVVAPRAAAPRLRGVRGARIGLLDNGKSNADFVVGAIGEALVREHGAAAVVVAKKPNAWVAAPDDAREALAGCDAVVTALGD
jgi:hypothetical protein